MLRSRTCTSGASISIVSKINIKFPCVYTSNHIDRPLNIVITGGTRGLGRALVSEFIKNNNNVIFTSRSRDNIKEIYQQINKTNDTNILYGIQSDISKSDDIEKFASIVKNVYPNIDLWINSAGISGGYNSFRDLSMSKISEIIATNLLGTILATKIASEIIINQNKPGHIINLAGAGSNGQSSYNYSAYGASKAGIVQFTRTIQDELQHDNVNLHILSPGMMFTDLLLENAHEDNKKIFNILCEHPEIVVKDMMPKILDCVKNNKRSVYFRYMTPDKIVKKLINYPFNKNQFFDKNGNQNL